MTISTFPPDRNVSRSSMRYEPQLQVEAAKSDEFDLTSGLRLIRRRIATIVALIALLMAPAVMVIAELKPTYHAESRLMIHGPLAKTLSSDESVGNDPLDLDLETERLLSRSVAERVIRDLRLEERREFNPALRKPSLVDKAREILRGWVSSQRPSLPVRSALEPIIPEYYSALRVWRVGGGNVFQIGFDASDPELAAAVPDRLISIYLQERKDSFRGRLDEAEEWIGPRIAEQEDRVRAARDAAETFQETLAVVSNDDAQGEQIQSIVELNDRQTKIEQSRAEVKATISTLGTAEGASLALQNIFIPDSIGTMERNLRAQQQELDSLLQTYDSNAEAAVDLHAKIARTRIDLGLAVNRYLQSMRGKLAALDREDSAVQSALATAHEQQSRSTLAQPELARLQRIVAKEQTTLDKLEDQRRALAGQAMLPGAEVEVLSPATVPLAPQGRGRLFYFIGALMASVSIAVTVAFVLEMFDKSVRSFDQIAGTTRFVPAGLIPRLRRKDRRNPPLRIGHIPDGMFDEAIRTAMISLKQSNGGKLPNSIVVTSAHSGEGKSLVARSLAIELVANGSPVLLVDGDLRHGNLDSFFKSNLKHGLNEFLSRQAEIQDVVHHHLASGIDFIPAGNPSLRRRAYLTDVAEIIEMARAKDQIVIFDSAPVLASTDTTQLTAIAERTLVVVQWGKTSRRAVEFTLQNLKSSRSSEVSVTINNVKPNMHSRYNFSDSELYVKSLMKYHNFES